MDFLGLGMRNLARGVRRGHAGYAGFGAALLALELIKRTTRPRRELLYARTLRPGEALRIRLIDGDATEELDVEG